MNDRNVRKLVLAAACVALGLVLPLLTGQIPEIGSKLCPLHIPILLCGFLCGWQYGLIAGFITPLLRSVIFGMPPMIPTALAMAFELAAYGCFAGLLNRLFPRKPGYVYVTLVLAMLLGRIVWGLASWAIYALFTEKTFTLDMFFAGAFVNAVPGIILHIALIPPIVLALRRAGIMDE